MIQRKTVSIYNDFLAPADETYGKLEDDFIEVVSRLFNLAEAANLNLREVSHEFQRVLGNIEASRCLLRASTILTEDEKER